MGRKLNLIVSKTKSFNVLKDTKSVAKFTGNDTKPVEQLLWSYVQPLQFV